MFESYLFAFLNLMFRFFLGQYAAEALYRIGETKSPEFRQQLQAELLQVVGQSSVNGQWGSVRSLLL